jgi:hypothetical protein
MLALTLAGGVGRADDAPAPRAAAGLHRPARAARAALLRQRGLEHFVNREYQLAADDLMEAYRIDKRAATLFAWAEAVRGAGDCELATRIYQHLLGKTAVVKLTRQAESGIAACEAAAPTAASAPVAAPPVIDPAIEPGAAADEVPTAAEPPEPVRVPAASPDDNPHLTSYLVMGGGGFTAVIGLAVFASGGDAGTGPNATHADATSARSSADWRKLIGASIAVIGGAVTLVGVVRYRSEPSRADSPALSIAPYFGGGGGGLVVSGRL